MVTKNNELAKQKWVGANWKHNAITREIPLFHAAALSLGIEPIKENIALAMQDADIKRTYEEYKKIIGLHLRPVPADSYVLYFPHHEFLKGVKGTNNRIIDLVSCIEFMQNDIRFKPVKEFIALKEPLSQKPINALTSLPSGVSLQIYSSGGEKEKLTAPKRDLSKSTNNRLDNNLALMVYAMATSAYKYDESATPSKKDEVINKIYDDFDKNNFKANGLGVDAIKNALKRGVGVAESKKIDL
jgi:hypothetical protein